MLIIMSKFMTCIVSLLWLSSLTNSIPLHERDVFDPQIFVPNASTVWTVGDTVSVTWNVTDAPSDLSNPIGMVVLGFLANSSENLMIDSPLASNFSILDGNVSFVVPPVSTRTDYIIVLFGDSGNASPGFTIKNGTSTSSSSSSSISSSASSGPTGSSSGVVVLPSTTSNTAANLATPSFLASPSSLTPPTFPTPSLVPIEPPSPSPSSSESLSGPNPSSSLSISAPTSVSTQSTSSTLTLTITHSSSSSSGPLPSNGTSAAVMASYPRVSLMWCLTAIVIFLPLFL